MKNYSRPSLLKELADEDGVVNYYKKVNGPFTRSIAGGYNMTYSSYLEEVVCELDGKVERRLLFWIFTQFKKERPELPLVQKRIAKAFDTTQQYVSKTINKLIKMEVLTVIRKDIRTNYYRLNPYLYLPAGANGVHLQDEWDLIKQAPSKIRDKFAYIMYLQSPEWMVLSEKIKTDRGNKCEKCNSADSLECHHLTYDNIYEEKDEDLQVLCNRCHTGVHIARTTSLNAPSSSGGRRIYETGEREYNFQRKFTKEYEGNIHELMEELIGLYVEQCYYWKKKVTDKHQIINYLKSQHNISLTANDADLFYDTVMNSSKGYTYDEETRTFTKYTND